MSHYKINERKCSTTLFPFYFIFFLTRMVVMVVEAMTSSDFKASWNNSQFTIPGPGVAYVTPTSSSRATTYLRFPFFPLPWIPKSHSLAKDWQGSASWEAGSIATLQTPSTRRQDHKSLLLFPSTLPKSQTPLSEGHDRDQPSPRTTGPGGIPSLGSRVPGHAALPLGSLLGFLMSGRTAPTPPSPQPKGSQ